MRVGPVGGRLPDRKEETAPLRAKPLCPSVLLPASPAALPLVKQKPEGRDWATPSAGKDPQGTERQSRLRSCGGEDGASVLLADSLDLT